MNRVPVNSSHLKSIGYNHGAKVLELEFQDSNIYQYNNVGLYTFNKLMTASSKGKYYNRYIRSNKNYSGTKITEPKIQATVNDVFWVVSKESGRVLDTRNSDESAFSRAEVLATETPGNHYHVLKVIGTVTLPKVTTPVRVRY